MHVHRSPKGCGSAEVIVSYELFESVVAALAQVPRYRQSYDHCEYDEWAVKVQPITRLEQMNRV